MNSELKGSQIFSVQSNLDDIHKPIDLGLYALWIVVQYNFTDVVHLIVHKFVPLSDSFALPLFAFDNSNCKEFEVSGYKSSSLFWLRPKCL